VIVKRATTSRSRAIIESDDEEDELPENAPTAKDVTPKKREEKFE